MLLHLEKQHSVGRWAGCFHGPCSHLSREFLHLVPFCSELHLFSAQTLPDTSTGHGGIKCDMFWHRNTVQQQKEISQSCVCPRWSRQHGADRSETSHGVAPTPRSTRSGSFTSTSYVSHEAWPGHTQTTLAAWLPHGEGVTPVGLVKGDYDFERDTLCLTKGSGASLTRTQAPARLVNCFLHVLNTELCHTFAHLLHFNT